MGSLGKESKFTSSILWRIASIIYYGIKSVMGWRGRSTVTAVRKILKLKGTKIQFRVSLILFYDIRFLPSPNHSPSDSRN